MTSGSLSQEIVRRQSNTEIVMAIFEAQPLAWIPWTVFSDRVGERAYRTRISNAKLRYEHEGRGTVESRTQTVDRRILTDYRFVPYLKLGPDAATPRTQKTLF